MSNTTLHLCSIIDASRSESNLPRSTWCHSDFYSEMLFAIVGVWCWFHALGIIHAYGRQPLVRKTGAVCTRRWGISVCGRICYGVWRPGFGWWLWWQARSLGLLTSPPTQPTHSLRSGANSVLMHEAHSIGHITVAPVDETSSVWFAVTESAGPDCLLKQIVMITWQA